MNIEKYTHGNFIRLDESNAVGSDSRQWMHLTPHKDKTTVAGYRWMASGCYYPTMEGTINAVMRKMHNKGNATNVDELIASAEKISELFSLKFSKLLVIK